MAENLLCYLRCGELIASWCLTEFFFMTCFSPRIPLLPVARFMVVSFFVVVAVSKVHGLVVLARIQNGSF